MNKIATLLLSTVILLLIHSCGQSGETSITTQEDRLVQDLSPLPSTKEFTGTGFNPEGPGSTGEAPVSYGERKQVVTGDLNIEVPDLDKAEAELIAALDQTGGFVELTRVSPGYRSFRLRIPAVRFDHFLTGVVVLGAVQHRTITNSDVTSQYYDLETRLKNQRLLLDQYRLLLTKSDKLDEILRVMAQISQVTTEIETAEGQFRYLSRQVEFSTLNVDFSLPPLAGGRTWPDWGAGLQDLGFTALEFAYGLLFLLLGVLIYGPVILGLLFFLVWIFRGKPGLWRRIITMTSSRIDR